MLHFLEVATKIENWLRHRTLQSRCISRAGPCYVQLEALRRSFRNATWPKQANGLIVHSAERLACCVRTLREHQGARWDLVLLQEQIISPVEKGDKRGVMTMERQRGNNDRPASDGGLQVTTDGGRGSYSPSAFSWSPLFSGPCLSLFPRCSLHQDAIIQDISREELKAPSAEEGPRVLCVSCGAHTQRCTKRW